MKTIKISLKNNHQLFKVFVNDIIEISLIENPTTGYLWYIDENSKKYDIIDKNYADKLTNPIGAGTNHIFELKIKKTSEIVEIKLTNMRIWNHDIIETFQFKYFIGSEKD